MKPKLSERERAALMTLGQKDPETLDPLEKHIRSEIGRLSMLVDKDRGMIDRLKADLTESETALTQNVGALQATARTYLAYLEANGAPSGPLGPSVAEQADPGALAPPIPLKPVPGPEGEPLEGDTKPKPRPEPEPEAE